MTERHPEIRNLVFEGGGPKDSAFAGCIEVLDTLGHYKQVRRVAGTSSGAITATLLACGAGSQGLSKSVYKTNFSQFIADRWGILSDIWRFLFRYGMHTGNGFVKILKKDIETYAGDAEITFRELAEKAEQDPETFKHLHVVTSNVSRQVPQVFSAEASPDLPVWKAVRASISLPLIFQPMIIDGDYYVDGGLAYVFPIDLFDEKDIDPDTGREVIKPNPKTLGFYLLSPGQIDSDKPFQPDPVRIHSLKSFAIAIVSYLTDTNNRDHVSRHDRERTVLVNDLGVKSTDFDLSKKKVEELVESGRAAARKFFGVQSS